MLNKYRQGILNMCKRRIQKAGKESQQYQVENMTIINGITEERARVIFQEQSLLARKEYTEEAYRIANERVGKFEERFMPRISRVEDAMTSFADPAFQMLLRRTQQTAATTEREADYDLLSELLVCHVQKGGDRKNRAAINRAVDIVDEIDNEALCGLTVAHAILHFAPVTGLCRDGLSALNNLFSKIMYQDLPSGREWLDHLDVLGAIRLISIAKSLKLEELYSKTLNGYICVGIKADSDNYQKAIEILEAKQVNREALVPNECLDGYYRIAIRNKDEINDPECNMVLEGAPLSHEKQEAIKKIFGLYSHDEVLLEQAKDNFVRIWDEFESLRILRQWWNGISDGFAITQVGMILSQINAKRCDPDLPDLL